MPRRFWNRLQLAAAMILLATAPAGISWAEPASAASAASASKTPKTPSVAKKARALIGNFESAGLGTVGIKALDLRTGKTLISHNAKTPMTPASNQKLLTSAFALARLGKNFRFVTAVCPVGKDLVLTGQADPLLGDPVLAAAKKTSIYADLDAWAARVRKAVGPTIEGDLLVRSRCPRQAGRHPDWAKRHWHQWYGAPVSDLNFHNNCFDVIFVKQGKRIVPSVTPGAPGFIQYVNRTKPGKKHLWDLRCNADDSTVEVRGTVKSTSTDPLSLPMNDPALTLGRVFASRLARAGVTIKGTVRRVDARDLSLAGVKPLATTKTPIAAVLTRANQRSLNMAAEAIFLRAGDGTWLGSAKKMHDTLVKTFALDPAGLTVRDGSGLSNKNRVSPANLAALLQQVATRNYGPMFLGSLPRNGINGTLKTRLRNEPYRGRLAAKTGYIAGVVTLSGYILDAEGKPAIAFSLLVNKAKNVGHAKKLGNQLAAALIDAAK